MIRSSSYLILCLCLSSFKLLFLKSYVSTDFDVHRNWMAITYNLPLNDWYFDTTSEWTLDYPPLFAIFELLLALGAHFLSLDDALLLSKPPIRSDSVIVYQKITVILSDFVYFYGVYKLCNSLEPLLLASRQSAAAADAKSTKAKNNNKPVASVEQAPSNTQQKSQTSASAAAAASTLSKDVEKQLGGGKNTQQVDKDRAPIATASSGNVAVPAKLNLADAFYRPDASSCIALLLLLQPGLLLVDHIHFQYNGLLSGILLISAAATIERRYMAASFWFALLLNLKHIYLYCAPAYGMYLLVAHCLARGQGNKQQTRILTFLFRAGRLGSIVISVFAITYTPFGEPATLRQLISRLFPFKRGLTHAYWAPNLWSLYNLADKILATVFKDSIKVNFDLESISNTKRITSTSGLVQEYEHLYLPSVKPVTTFVLVGVFMLPIALKFLFRIDRRSPRLFLKGLTLAAFTSFMFGWHVHEKAILLVLLPVVPLCFTDPHLRNAFLRLTLAGTYSLFPLLHQPAEYPIKVCLLLAFYIYASALRPAVSAKNNNKHQVTTNRQYILVDRVRAYSRQLFGLLDKAYVVTLMLNELYIILLFGRLNHSWNPAAKLNKFEFLPLMLTSTLTAAGIATSYLELYYDFVLCADELALGA